MKNSMYYKVLKKYLITTQHYRQTGTQRSAAVYVDCQVWGILFNSLIGTLNPQSARKSIKQVEGGEKLMGIVV